MFKMYYRLIILSVWFLLELVTANPLVQSIPSWPLHTPTHYQQNVYRPYSEAFILQPNNIIPYPQQIEIQNPLSYQPTQELLLQDSIYQFYRDKLLSNPTVKSIIDPNNSMNSKDANEMQIISRNPCLGDIVNNYIIIPPEYLSINKTAPEQTDTRVNNNSKDPKKDNSARSSRKKKKGNKGDVLLNNMETQSGKKHLNTVLGNFDVGNIKCYTSAEVLNDRNSKMKQKHEKNKELNKSNRKNAVKCAKLNKTCDNNIENIKPRKSKKNKTKKKLPKSENKDNTNKIMDCTTTKTTKKKKYKQQESDSDNCDCDKNSDVSKTHCETKVSDTCALNIDDLFGLKKDCIDLENRRPRNSKNDAATNDFRKMYSNLPEDLTRNYAWYMNDLFFNPMVANTDLTFFPGNNMYPYDLNQIYKMPQYSNTDVNKTSGNKARSRNTKKKKKQKGKNATKNKNESNYFSEKDDNALKPPKEKEPEKTTDIQTPRIDQIDSIENTTQFNKINLTITLDSLSTEQIGEDLKLIEEPVELIQVTDILNSYDISEKAISRGTTKGEQIKLKEIFETQIPESVNTHKANKDNADEFQGKEKTYDESQIVADSYEFEQTPEIELEEEIPYIIDYRILEDYYPDFTKDNLGYIVSSEELDIQNIRDRYFYTTDRNIESQESYRRKPNEINVSKDTISYNDNEAEIDNEAEKNNEAVKDELIVSNAGENRAKENRESEEIVFRTPPGLDFPDFITRKINKNRQDSTEYFYEHNNDDEYDRFNFDNSAENSDLHLKTARKFSEPVDLKSGNVVETVYARSKVVKYGQSQVSEKTLKPKASGHFVDVPESTFQNDKDKTIVIAKSISPNDNW